MGAEKPLLEERCHEVREWWQKKGSCLNKIDNRWKYGTAP